MKGGAGGQREGGAVPTVMTCLGWDATTGQNSQRDSWDITRGMAWECSGDWASWGTQCSFLTDASWDSEVKALLLIARGGAPWEVVSPSSRYMWEGYCQWITLDPRPPKGDWK